MKSLNSKIPDTAHLTNDLLEYCIGCCILSRHPSRSVVDVGTGHGKLAIYIKQKWNLDVTATDGQIGRVPLDTFKQLNISFIHEYLEETKFVYDIVLLSGIFYHLDVSQQITLLRKIQESQCNYLILNTHICNESSIAKFKLQRVNMPPLVGGIYTEGSKRGLKAALNNYYSFWHTLDSIEKLLTSNGFQPQLILPQLTENRNFIWCTKTTH